MPLTLLEHAELMNNHPLDTLQDARYTGSFKWSDVVEWAFDQQTLRHYAEERYARKHGDQEEQDSAEARLRGYAAR